MSEVSPLSDQTGPLSAEFMPLLNQMRSDAQRLDAALKGAISAAQQRGVRISTDVGALGRGLSQEFEATQKNALQLDAQIHQLQELVHTSALLTSTLDLNAVLEEVIDTVIRLTDAERAYLMLRDTASGELQVRAARRWGQETILAEEISYSRGLINTAIEQRAPIITSNSEHDPRFKDLHGTMGFTFRSVVCIPLVSRAETVGVLYADKRIARGLFGPESVPMLTAFANQAAIAIENARLFEQVKKDLDAVEREAQSIQIQIDQQKTDIQVDEIINTEFFRKLRESGRNRRENTTQD